MNKTHATVPVGWNTDLEKIPKDGRWVLILTEYDEPQCVYMSFNSDGSEFGWTSDGGDRANPKCWASVGDEDGRPIFKE